MDLLTKINKHNAIVGVIGLGHIGLPLLIEFCKAGFPVIGFDVDEWKIQTLSTGKTYVNHIPSELIKSLKKAGNFSVTADYSMLKDVDCIVVCVPAPPASQGEPNLSYMLKTMETIVKYLKKGQLITLESTTYPGTSDEEMRKVLESSGMKAGRDFFLACSPQLDGQYDAPIAVSSALKFVGGYSSACLKAGTALYRSIVQEVVPVSSNKVAEAAKLLEDSYQAVNVALVNELKILFERMDIDIWEVIKAAEKRSASFQAFYPGPGLDGHYSSTDPFYLTWRARAYGYHTKIIELAGEINTSMPSYVTGKVIDELNYRGKSIKTSKILVLGLSCKKDCNDTRDSPSFKLIGSLMQKGAFVDYNDPYVPLTKKSRGYNLNMSSIPLTEESLRGYDCVVIATAHSSYDYKFIADHAALVVDTRNAMSGYALEANNVVKA